jgi:small multidrug resistance pump
MNRWALLGAAIVTEIAGTLALRAALEHRGWFAVVPVAYLVSFYTVGKVLTRGIPLGVVYGIWGATGVAATAILAVPLFGDPFTLPMALGLMILLTGVLLVQFGFYQATKAPDTVDDEFAPW